MPDAERNIQMAINVTPDDAIRSFKRLQTEAQKTFDSLSTDNLTKSEEKSLSTLSKIVSKGEEAVKTIEKFSQPIETKEYTKLSQEYEKLARKIEEAETKKQQLLNKGGKGSTNALKALDEKLITMRSKLYDIDVELDKVVTEGRQFEINNEGLEQAKNSLVDINNQLLLQNQAVGETNQQHTESAQKLAEIEQKILAIQQDAGPIDEEFFKVSNALKNVNAELDRLYARQSELEQAGRGLGFEEYDNNLAKIRELETEQERLNGEVDAYREKVSQPPALTIWERVQDLFKQIGQDIAHPIRKIQQLRSSMDEASGGARNANSAFGKLLSTLGGLGTKFISNVSGINRFSKALSGVTSKANQSSFNFKKLFNTLLKYGIGVRSLFVLYRKIRSAITENIKYYALMNNGMNQTNRAISAMQSSLNALKGALAGAFVPIINVVSPILSNLIDQLASVITAIGMFIAKLTGAKTYLKAVKKDTNYAAGLSSGGSGKSAQEKYEEAVKKAQEKYDKKVAETEAKNAERMAKAEEKQAKAADKLAKKQEKANNKLADFDDLNVLGVDTLEELEEQEADLLDMPELELPNLEDFTGSGGGASDPFGFEEIPLDDFEWNWDDLLAKAEELGRGFADMLNNIFADEDLAKKIGNTIGNLINMAIAFAYGFINRFDFLQFGRWLGVLLQEAIDTIRWDVLGTAIGEGLNGLADSVIGFFQTYNAGSIGAAMAEMFNNAIEAIIPERLGEALADRLKAPLIELRQFLTDANMTLAGEKFRRFFIEVFQNKVLGNETLGQTIGTTIGTLINKAVAFFLAMDVSKLVAALCKFFNDIFFSAITTIDWPSLGELLYALTIGMLVGVLQGVADFIDKAVRLINPDWADALDVEGFNYWLDENFGSWDRYVDALQNGVKTLDGMMTPVESGLESLNIKLDEFTNGTAVNWGQALRDIQAEYQLTDDDMQTVLDLFVAQNDKVQESSEILSGYEGDWLAYKDTIKDVPAFIQPTIEQQKLLDDAIKNTGDTAQDTKDDITDYITVSKEQMQSGVANAQEYEDKTVDAMQGISDKSDEVVISFDTLTEQLNAELEGLTLAIDTWYQTMITTYFGYDVWLTLLQEGPLLAFTDFFNTLFLAEFDTQMQLWWDEHVKKWFAEDLWTTDITSPWFTFIKNKWTNVLIPWWNQALQDWWKDLKKKYNNPFLSTLDKALNDLWENHIKPWFDREKYWDPEFKKIVDAADEAFQKVEEHIITHITTAKEAVISACDEMIEKLREVLDLIGEVQSAYGGGGGGGSSSGGGGGNGGSNGGTGGSGGSNFMPMLNVMHFEDNLGMSAFKFPELATGAVIPPNNKFLAVLGDQKSGMNIETPLATMVEAFRSVMDEYMNPSMRNATMEVDGETFARLMMPHMMDEANRLGYNTEIIEGI